MTDLTATAKKIMEVFRYFRVNTLSLKLFLTRTHLWQDVEKQEVHDALNELIRRGYIMEIEEPPAWRLLEPGAQYVRRLKRR